MQEQLASLESQTYGTYTLNKHVGELLNTITQEQPADALGALEDMSRLLWDQRHVQRRPQAPVVPTEELDRCTDILGLLEKLNSEAASKVDTLFFEFSDKWAETGISIDQDDSLLLKCALIKLAEAEEIIAVRFWGSFNTPSGVIYVAEADIPLDHRQEDAPTVGPYDVPAEIGVGVNRYVYYVTKSPFDDWIRLPDARPSDISISRKVVWQLTGELSAAVHSFVPFDVTEDIYMRALIARISSATILAPSGYIIEYTPEEEEEKNEPAENEEEEEEKEPAPKQLKLIIDPEFEGVEVDGVEWVHVRPFILPQGRETYKKAPKQPKQPKPKKEKAEKKERTGEEEEEEEERKEEEEERKEEEEEPEEPEEGVELFGSIENDEGFGEEIPCWNFRNVASPIEGQSFVVAESLRWPGAYNLTDGKKSCSVYYGDGTKFVVNGFQPPAPPPIAGEFRKRMTEQIDPTLDQEKELEKMKNPPKEEEEENGEAEADE